jgi:hypothetical protein
MGDDDEQRWLTTGGVRDVRCTGSGWVSAPVTVVVFYTEGQTHKLVLSNMVHSTSRHVIESPP